MAELRSDWLQRPLGDLLTLRYGTGLPSRRRRPGPYPVYGSGGIIGYHDEPLVPGPGIIVGRKGSIGTVHYEGRSFFPIDTVFFVELKDPEVDLRYVYYMLKASALYTLNTDAAVPGLNRDVAHRQVFGTPPFPVQRKIASILSAYDGVIENNLRRIQILEEVAQLVYREWFVKFRFPGHEKVRMVDSPLGKIPETWKETALGEVTALIKRGIAPAYDESSPSIVINQRCIRHSRLDMSQSRRHRKTVPVDRYVVRGDVLVNSTGVGTLGRVAQVQTDLPDCTVDTHVTIVRPADSQDPDFFGLQVLSLEPLFQQQGRGTTGQTELNREAISNAPYRDPGPALQRRFGSAVRRLRVLSAHLAPINDVVRQTRDLLLPKLVSGELDVSDLDVDVREATP